MYVDLATRPDALNGPEAQVWPLSRLNALIPAHDDMLFLIA